MEKKDTSFEVEEGLDEFAYGLSIEKDRSIELAQQARTSSLGNVFALTRKERLFVIEVLDRHIDGMRTRFQEEEDLGTPPLSGPMIFIRFVLDTFKKERKQVRDSIYIDALRSMGEEERIQYDLQREYIKRLLAWEEEY